MGLENRLTGREEKRLPIMMEAKLVPAESVNEERLEKARIENISAHGARVQASRPWQPGEQVDVTPTLGEGPLRGEVIYCQKLAGNRFVIGLRFRQSPVLSSTFYFIRDRGTS